MMTNWRFVSFLFTSNRQTGGWRSHVIVLAHNWPHWRTENRVEMAPSASSNKWEQQSSGANRANYVEKLAQQLSARAAASYL